MKTARKASRPIVALAPSKIFLFLVVFCIWILPLQEAHAAISYVGSASTPADSGAQAGPGPVAVTPPAMQAGDFVLIIGAYRGNTDISISATGGQTWTTLTYSQRGTVLRTKLFYCIFNGTWSANPSISIASGTNALSAIMHVFRGVDSTNPLDVNQVVNNYAAPASPYDVTITGITTNTDGAWVIAVWGCTVLTGPTWTLQTAGWANAGGAQYRNTTGTDISISAARIAIATAGASGNVTNRESGAAQGTSHILALRPQVPPNAPVATAATNVQATSFSANWNASLATTGYRLDVATDSGFTSFVTGYNNLDVGNVLTWSVSSNISPSTTYYYRVRAYNGYGTSGSSNTINLTTLAATLLYRSVGTNAADLNTGLRTVTISGSTATFSGAMPDNVGVGDALTYTSGGAQLAFIRGRTSSTVFTVMNKNGGTPTAAPALTAVGVYRAYTSLANWQSQTENPNINEPVENDVNPSMNLVTANTTLNVACYGDGVDTTAVAITGWTTGANNYIKIYTPYLSSEVGVSQRHSGMWDTGKYRLEVPGSSGNYAIVIEEENVRLDGLQIYVTSVSYDWTKAVNISDILLTTVDLRISNCIIRGAGNSSKQGHSGIDTFNLTGTGTVKIWNNIIYDFRPANDNFGIASSDCTNITFYLYNNTIYNCSQGITAWAGTSGTVIAKNNISYSNATYNYYESSGFSGSSTNNLSGPTFSDAPGSNPQNAKTLTFVSTVSPYDLHLATSDTNAIDKGADLSGEFFSDDIDRETRPYGSYWDIGADEYTGAFLYRRQITIADGMTPTANCSSNLPNFPFLVSYTDATLKSATNGGHVQNANGNDIIFRALDDTTCGGAGTSPCTLDHEIEKYDGTTGTLVAWVRIPTLVYNANTTIYMYYGNAAVTSSTANPTGVWDSSYVGVWHLNQSSGTGYYLLNSKQNNYHANANSTTYLASPAGLILDGARDFNNSNCDVQNGGSLFSGDSAFTLELWGYPDYATDAEWTLPFEANILDSDSLNICRWRRNSAGPPPVGKGELQCDVHWFGGAIDYFTSSNDALTRQAWNHIVLTYDGANLKWYVNGSQNSQLSRASSTLLANSGVLFGDNAGIDSNFDEYRYSRTARNACWIGTEYNNQSNPGTFITLGSEQSPAPTAVKLTSFTATEYSDGVLLKWKTSYEVDNLGFHVYREENGERVRLTPELVAGSALLAGSRTALTAGHHYSWWDVSSLSAISHQPSAIKYWLKDIDLNGTHTMHGPVTPVFSLEPIPERFRPELLSEVGLRLNERYQHYWKVQELKERLGNKRSAMGHRPSAVRRASNLKAGGRSSNLKGRRPAPQGNLVPDPQTQQYLAGRPAVKLFVKDEGWYRVTQAELVAAGLSSKVNPKYLQLYTDGKEQPIRVISKREGRFGPGDTIEFYGEGLDTPSTDTRVYWLIEGTQPGKRIHEFKSYSGSLGSLSSSSFPYTVEKKERRMYISALKNGDEENFFGAVVARAPVDQMLRLSHLDPSPSEEAMLEVSLQGVTNAAHRVKVELNGADVGEVAFEGMVKGLMRWAIPQSGLEEGENLVTLEALGGEKDVSLVDHIRLTYWHTYTAEDNGLRLTARGGHQVSIDGFSHPNIRVIDMTDSRDVIEVIGKVGSQQRGYAVSFRVPGHGERTLLAFTEERVKSPEEIIANQPSSWHESGQGYDLVIISYRDFLGSLQPLKRLRESQGLRVALIDIEDLYDEFNFGMKSPKAIKDFLTLAKTHWRKPPRYVLLVGDASFDPRNYYGFGDVDFVPTKLIDTVYMETASDDWFVDLNNDGLPEMAIGRLPVQTAEEAAIVVSKIVGYGQATRLSEALLVSDMKGEKDLDFEAASEEVRGMLPPNINVRKISRSNFPSDPRAREEIIRDINLGPLLVNFIGHGTVWGWNGDLLSTGDADYLTNGMRLPFFVNMTCLNGWFHDPYLESLAEALLKAKGGGAVAVWTSSGLTEPDKQTVMNKELMKLLFGRDSLTLGEATAKAKSSVSDQDIRKTWILFGDPTTRLRQ